MLVRDRGSAAVIPDVLLWGRRHGRVEVGGRCRLHGAWIVGGRRRRPQLGFRGARLRLLRHRMVFEKGMLKRVVSRITLNSQAHLLLKA